MFSITYTRSFERDIKKAKKRGYDTRIINEVIKTLESTGTVPEKLKPVNTRYLAESLTSFKCGSLYLSKPK